MIIIEGKRTKALWVDLEIIHKILSLAEHTQAPECWLLNHGLRMDSVLRNQFCLINIGPDLDEAIF